MGLAGLQCQGARPAPAQSFWHFTLSPQRGTHRPLHVGLITGLPSQWKHLGGVCVCVSVSCLSILYLYLRVYLSGWGLPSPPVPSGASVPIFVNTSASFVTTKSTSKSRN